MFIIFKGKCVEITEKTKRLRLSAGNFVVRNKISPLDLSARLRQIRDREKILWPPAADLLSEGPSSLLFLLGNSTHFPYMHGNRDKYLLFELYCLAFPDMGKGGFLQETNGYFLCDFAQIDV